MTLENQNNEQENLSNDEISDADNPNNYPDQIAQNAEVKEEQAAEEKVNKEKTVENAANKTEKKAEEETKSNKTAEDKSDEKANNENKENIKPSAANSSFKEFEKVSPLNQPLQTSTDLKKAIIENNPNAMYGKDDPINYELETYLTFVRDFKLLLENFREEQQKDRKEHIAEFKNSVDKLKQSLKKDSDEIQRKIISDISIGLASSVAAIKLEADNFIKKIKTDIPAVITGALADKKEEIISTTHAKAQEELNSIKNVITELVTNSQTKLEKAAKRNSALVWIGILASFFNVIFIVFVMYFAFFGR